MRYLIEGLLVVAFAVGPVLPILPLMFLAGMGGDISGLDHSGLAVLPWLVLFTVPIAVVYAWLRLLGIFGSILWKEYWKSK